MRDIPLPELLTEDTPIEIVNKKPKQHFKDIYDGHIDPADGFYAAFVEVCKMELDMMRERAMTAPPAEKDKVWEDQKGRHWFFDLEQETTALAAAHAGAAAALAAMAGHKAAITGSSKPGRPADPSATSSAHTATHGH